MNNNKTYWKGIEELEQSPSFLAKRENEFPEEIAIDEFLGDNKLKETSTARRDFLKFMGFSLAAATLAACESPVVNSIPYIQKPDDVDPGVANWYASTYYDGYDYASILVKTREGRPIFIKGNKKFGINKGAGTARITASVLPLYDTARLSGPTIDGNYSDWATVDAQITKTLENIAKTGGKTVLLTNTIISPSTLSVIDTFKNKVYPEGSEANFEHVTYDALSYSAIRQANKDSFDLAVIPDYDFSKAKVIVSISADFLTNWLLHTEYIGQYLQNRKPENEWMSRHFQYESILSVTGANADVRVAIKPSEEVLVAAAIYQHISGNKIANVPQHLLELTADAAKELKNAGNASLVVAGSNNVVLQTIVNAINDKLGNYTTTINLNNPVSLFQGNDKEVAELMDEIRAGKIKALIMYGVNPVYTLPNGKEFAELLSKIELTVSFNGYADETASKCKYVCPDHHYLEAWNDFQVKKNHYALAQPAIRPLYETRAAQESLMVWCGEAQRGDKDNDTYYNIIKANWALYGFPQQTAYTTVEEYWNYMVHNGSGSTELTPPSAVPFMADLSALGQKITSSDGPESWEVVLYTNAAMGIGNQANNPWLQELPDPITKVTWDNYITMSPADMKELGFNTHIGQEEPASVASIKVGETEMKLPVYPQPGQARKTVGIALGYGRGENGENIGKSAFQYGQYGEPLMQDGKPVSVGKNAFIFTSFVNGYISYSNVVSSINDANENYLLACTQTHHTIMGRNSVVRETTFSFYKTAPKEAYNEPHELHYYGEHKPVEEIDLWKSHPVEEVGHRWGMSVDLNTCIGCGNCLVACQAENNVPVVGKDEIRRSRDMHWLRIDRYYSSDMNKEKAKQEHIGAISMYAQMEIPSENSEVVFMPMMCQHCNHAPCETVCPVAATTHSNEGLNMMAYNRCIGTRYCANNCPYKVRRFNWFNYTAYKKFTAFNPSQDDMMRMVLNPDVTVRTRGVMEKCTMCVQRIQAGKLEAKKAGKKVKDGDIVTACADSCPTDAITFGDWNDENSQIRKNSESKRAYQALEEVGVKPNIWYLLKVRNVEKEMVQKHHEPHTEEKHNEHA
jgi:molybdopterin-containing oxidoreductase family iron-sulfur binding subunit